MRFKKLLAAVLTVTLASLSLTNIAAAQTDPLATTVLTTTVPVFGTGMTIEISIDSTTGEFQSATIAAADAGDSAAAAAVADLVQSTSTEHGGFELKFTNSTTGVEVEVSVVDNAITKTEIETRSPSENGGPGVWTGDPLGNGDTVTVAYDVTVGTDGVPVIAVTAPTAGTNTFFSDLGSKTSTHEGETTVTHTIQVYDGGTIDDHGTIDPLDDTIVDGSQDSLNLVIRAKVEHGQLEVEVSLVDPSNTKGHDDDDNESDDHESGDDRGDERGDDRGDRGDERGDDRGDDDSHDEGRNSGHDDDQSHDDGPEDD